MFTDSSNNPKKDFRMINPKLSNHRLIQQRLS